MAKARAMKVTTVRFSEDLWAAVATEAERSGVSASQFIREAALARAAAAAGSRGEAIFDSYSSAMDEIGRGPGLREPDVDGVDERRVVGIRDRDAAIDDSVFALYAIT